MKAEPSMLGRSIALAVLIFSSVGLRSGSRFDGACAQSSHSKTVSPQDRLAKSSWPRYRGNARNTGLSGQKPIGRAKPWTFESLGRRSWSDPAIGPDGTVFVCTDSLYALDGRTGKKRWEFHLPEANGYSPVLGLNNALYVGGNVRTNGVRTDCLFALDATTGKPRWATPVTGYVRSVPAVASDGTVFVATLKGWVYALDGTSGRPMWSVKTSHEIYGALAIGIDGSLLAASDFLYALDPQSE